MSLRWWFLALFAWRAVAETAPAVIRIGNSAEPRDLDPHLVTGIPEAHILFNLFEGLTSKDPRTGEPTPGVADRWAVSADGKVYTFHLRKDAKWSNGDPVTAGDFVYAWTRLLTPATGAEFAYYAYAIRGARAFNQGKAPPAGLGFRAAAPDRLIVTLEHPTPYFLSLLAHHSLYPLHRATLEKFGRSWTRPENMVSNGPFVLADWKLNQVVRLRRNPRYWGAAEVKLEGAEFYPIDRVDTEEAMFRAGQLDITGDVPLEKIAVWRKDPRGLLQQSPYLGTYFIWFNVTRPPFDKVPVRRALALAIDRQRLVDYVVRGGQSPGTAFTPPGCGGGYEPPAAVPPDGRAIAEAKAALGEAGYPDGKGFPVTELLYNTSEGQKKIAEAIQEMWRRNLGIEVRLYNQDWKVYLDNKRTGNFQMCRGSWIGDYNDPTTFLQIFTTGTPTNAARWSDPAYDQLIAKAADERSQERRFQILHQAESRMLAALPVIPIYFSTRLYLKAASVNGWYNNIEDIHPLKFVWK
jgi:oligopeptide transport system substrate-binding protein